MFQKYSKNWAEFEVWLVNEVFDIKMFFIEKNVFNRETVFENIRWAKYLLLYPDSLIPQIIKGGGYIMVVRSLCCLVTTHCWTFLCFPVLLL